MTQTAIRTNGTRFEQYYKSEFYREKTKNPTYNYESNGILVNIMSHKIIESRNKFLQEILSFVEKSLLYLLKYTDELKRFKDVHWKNR